MSETTAPPMATPRVAAGVLFFDAYGRVLLVQPTYKDHWDIPGGYVEPGESPLSAARREVTEELGLKVPLEQLLVVDWAPNEGEGDKLLFIFDGGELPAAARSEIVLPPDELAEYSFVDVAELTRRLIPRLARRVHGALAARSHGLPRYLEHGAEAPDSV